MLNKMKNNILYKIFIEYFALVMILLFVADIVTKVVFEKLLLENGSIIVGSCFDFTLVYNQGAFFGMMGSLVGHIILIIISLLGGIAMIYVLIKYKNKFNKGMLAGLVMAIPGDLGNLVDRCIYKDGEFRGVIDFCHFHIDAIGFDWAVFNVADILLVAGIITFAIYYFIHDLEIEKQKKIAMEELEASKRKELEEMNKGGENE